MPDRIPHAPTPARGTNLDLDQAKRNWDLTMRLIEDPLGIGGGSLTPAGAPPPNDFLRELVGKIFQPKNGGEAIRLTSGDPAANLAQFHGVKSGTALESTMPNAAKLIRGGELVESGPAAESVASLVAKLLKLVR